MDEFAVPACFEEVWTRVTEITAQNETPLTKCQELERFMEGELASISAYKSLLGRCGARERRCIAGILADERRHLGQLQLEYFMETGDSYVPVEKHHSRSGLISALRESSLAETDTCSAYRSAAQGSPVELREIYMAIAEDEERHSRLLRDMVGRCFRQQG